MKITYTPSGLNGWAYPDERPKTRGECYAMPRPCPFVSCRYHLAIDAHKDWGNNYRLRLLCEDPTIMANTCALDVADGMCDLPDTGHGLGDEAAEVSLEEIGAMVGVQPQRVQQNIEAAQAAIRAASEQHLVDYAIEDDYCEEPLTQSQIAAETILAELSKGPRHRSQLKEALRWKGLSPRIFDHGRRLLGSRIAPLGNKPSQRGIWQRVDRQARTVDPGHAKQTGGTK